MFYSLILKKSKDPIRHSSGIYAHIKQGKRRRAKDDMAASKFRSRANDVSKNESIFRGMEINRSAMVICGRNCLEE